MASQVKDILDSGFESVVRMADFFDYGSYLLFKRQIMKLSDSELEAVEEVTADKLFRLFHKYSLALRKSIELGDISDSSTIDVCCGLDCNGIHGKGIAFPLKPNPPDPGDFGFEAELVDDIVDDVSKGKKSPPIFCLKAIVYMDSFLPDTVKKLEPIFFPNGRRGYKSNIVGDRFDKWKESGRLSTEGAFVLDSFADFITKLSDRELICLGRHESAKATKDSLKYLFIKWWSLVEERCSELDQFPADDLVLDWKFVKGFKDTYHCSEEIACKLVYDKEDYVSALSKLQGQGNRHLEPLTNYQASADEIWDSGIKRFVGLGHIVHTFTTFAYLIIAKHPKSRYRVPPYVDPDISHLPQLLESLLGLKLSDFFSFSQDDFERLRKEASKKGTSPLMFDYGRFWEGGIGFSDFLKFFKETSKKIRETCQKYLSLSNNPTFESEN